jgi:response regulator RpfG family c-di-GMP phosphodiesterase
MLEQKILIVDDYEPNLIALESVLGDDIPLIRATSGRQALKLLLEHDISLVLLDVQMPEMDGFEVAKHIRNNPKTKALTIIFLTAISKEERFINEGYRVGAVDYLCKPISPTILRSKVDFFMKLDLQRRELGAKLALAHAHLDAYKNTVTASVGTVPRFEKAGIARPDKPEPQAHHH